MVCLLGAVEPSRAGQQAARQRSLSLERWHHGADSPSYVTAHLRRS
ncbi:MAG: hypothetical protein OJF51_000582 [Nitrospira sp.]|nr:MAG: hypothetical protein OJF51_000582 [Nitrospira sp.]